MTLSRAETIELLRLDAELARRTARRKLFTYFPDSGPLRRELYPKHLAFFEAGLTHRQRPVDLLAGVILVATMGEVGDELGQHGLVDGLG